MIIQQTWGHFEQEDVLAPTFSCMYKTRMSETPPTVIHVDDAPTISRTLGDHWGAHYKIMTPSMRPKGGSLGVNHVRVPPGRLVCPFHSHQLEDEVFFILSGTGTLRYGDEISQLKTGDCVSCPAGTGIAHQIANTGQEDLVYLSIGRHDPNEVCVYPDNGKVMVRSLQRVGRLSSVEYLDGEPNPPKIFEMASKSNPG